MACLRCSKRDALCVMHAAWCCSQHNGSEKNHDSFRERLLHVPDHFDPFSIVSRNYFNGVCIHDIFSISFLYIVHRTPAQNVLLMALTLDAFKLSITDMVSVRTQPTTYQPSNPSLCILVFLSLCRSRPVCCQCTSRRSTCFAPWLSECAFMPRPFIVQMLRHLPLLIRSFCFISVAFIHSRASHSPPTAARCPSSNPNRLPYLSKCSSVDGVVSDPPRQALHAVSCGCDDGYALLLYVCTSAIIPRGGRCMLHILSVTPSPLLSGTSFA
jgi:hypothetical protein